MYAFGSAGLSVVLYLWQRPLMQTRPVGNVGRCSGMPRILARTTQLSCVHAALVTRVCRNVVVCVCRNYASLCCPTQHSVLVLVLVFVHGDGIIIIALSLLTSILRRPSSDLSRDGVRAVPFNRSLLGADAVKC